MTERNKFFSFAVTGSKQGKYWAINKRIHRSYEYLIEGKDWLSSETKRGKCYLPF